MTAIGTAIYEDDVTERLDETPDTYLERIHKETKGVVPSIVSPSRSIPASEPIG
jgi:hypothetical protein